MGFELSTTASEATVPRPSREVSAERVRTARLASCRHGLALTMLIIVFLGLEYLLPLGRAIKIGADEDYELAKATLCNHGYRLYTEIWDDQPPLVTTIIAKLSQHASNQILPARLLTVSLSVVLLSATFILVRAVNGQLVAILSAALFICSPGFLELSCSVMQEILAFAPVVASLCLLWTGPRDRHLRTVVLAGMVFGFALQMKLIGVVYLPVAGLILWLRNNPPFVEATFSRKAWVRFLSNWLKASFFFGLSLMLAFIALNCLTGNSLVLQVQQSWAAHFAQTKSFEYGSPSEHGFDWTVPLKNWDALVPALVGLCILLGSLGKDRAAVIPVAWLGLSLLVFGTHKPWWPYYYIHCALPLCWSAGVGLREGWVWSRSLFAKTSMESKAPIKTGSQRLPRMRVGRERLPYLQTAALGILALCALVWMGTRVYLEEQAIRRAPRIDSALVLKQIQRFKPFCKFMFCDRPVYSFHADLPMPPHLGVISLKRFWTGDLSNAGLAAELNAEKPGLILIGRDSHQVPYEDLLLREYRLVYQDGENRLYAHESISKKPSLLTTE